MGPKTGQVRNTRRAVCVCESGRQVILPVQSADQCNTGNTHPSRHPPISPLQQTPHYENSPQQTPHPVSTHPNRHPCEYSPQQTPHCEYSPQQTPHLALLRLHVSLPGMMSPVGYGMQYGARLLHHRHCGKNDAQRHVVRPTVNRRCVPSAALFDRE